MNNIKKLLVCAVALCSTVPAFGLTTDKFPATQQTQEQLTAQMLGYLEQGKVEDIEKLVKRISGCQESYNLAESSFRAAAKQYFALKTNSEYLDYEKMYQFYKQNKATWSANVLYNWMMYWRNVSLAQNVFAFKVSGLKNYPDMMNILIAHEVDGYKAASQWQQDATTVYNDPDTYAQLKWAVFSGVKFVFAEHLLSTLSDTKFWNNFAMEPLGKDKQVKDAQKKEIQKKVKEVYAKCYAENKERRSMVWNCENIRLQAKRYRYWDDSADRTRREMHALVFQLAKLIANHI